MVGIVWNVLVGLFGSVIVLGNSTKSWGGSNLSFFTLFQNFSMCLGKGLRMMCSHHVELVVCSAWAAREWILVWIILSVLRLVLVSVLDWSGGRDEELMVRLIFFSV